MPGKHNLVIQYDVHLYHKAKDKATHISPSNFSFKGLIKKAEKG